MLVIKNWKSVFPDRLIVVRYEDLVSKPEQVLPDLLQRCGLEFDENIYRFHRKKDPVTTSSVAQVSQPLNERAIGSAQHVIEHMQPFLDAYSA